MGEQWAEPRVRREFTPMGAQRGLPPPAARLYRRPAKAQRERGHAAPRWGGATNAEGNARSFSLTRRAGAGRGRHGAGRGGAGTGRGGAAGSERESETRTRTWRGKQWRGERRRKEERLLANGRRGACAALR